MCSQARRGVMNRIARDNATRHECRTPPHHARLVDAATSAHCPVDAATSAPCSVDAATSSPRPADASASAFCIRDRQYASVYNTAPCLLCLKVASSSGTGTAPTPLTASATRAHLSASRLASLHLKVLPLSAPFQNLCCPTWVIHRRRKVPFDAEVLPATCYCGGWRGVTATRFCAG